MRRAATSIVACLYGARISLTVGIVSQLINTCIGVALGLSAAYWGGWWDDFVNGLTNMMLAIPSLVFALAIMAILNPGLTSLLIALGLTNWSFTCRLTRAATLSVKQLGYVEAAALARLRHLSHHADADPAQYRRPDHRHRHAWHGGAVLAEASLSFLGLGIRPPFPSWGSMLSDARDQISTAPWISIFPGLAIFLTVLGLNLLGDGLRDIPRPSLPAPQSLTDRPMTTQETPEDLIDPPLETIRFHGLKAGPKLLVSGAVHGNETCGPNRHRPRDRGLPRRPRRGPAREVTFLPVANPKAYRQNTREGGPQPQPRPARAAAARGQRGPDRQPPLRHPAPARHAARRPLLHRGGCCPSSSSARTIIAARSNPSAMARPRPLRRLPRRRPE